LMFCQRIDYYTSSCLPLYFCCKLLG
jgi:hypothetical protein